MQPLRLTIVAAFFGVCGALKLDRNASFTPNNDQLLNVQKLVATEGCLGGWNAINPSFVFVPDSEDVAVAFGGLCIKKNGSHASWHHKTVIGTIPDSEIRLPSRTTLNWTSLHVAPDFRFSHSEGKTECQMPGLDYVEGPEDPRLVQTAGGLYAIVTGYSLAPSPGGGSPACGEHGMLLHAAKITNLTPVTFAAPKELTFQGMGKVEKNWAMFTPATAKGSTVRAVYSVYPHKIASVNLATGHVAFVAISQSKAMAKLAHRLGTSPRNFHGGAGVAHVTGAAGRDYFLSMFHVVARTQGGRQVYWNYPYKFSAHAPYKVLHVGKRMRLKALKSPAYGEVVAFVTTVLYDHGHLFIGYGAGDRSSRTLRMSMGAFNANYFPSSLLEGEDEVSEDVDLDDMEFLDVAEFGSENFTCTSENITAHCRDFMTPSVCRSCSELTEEAEAEAANFSDQDDAESEGAVEDGKDQEKEDEQA